MNKYYLCTVHSLSPHKNKTSCIMGPFLLMENTGSLPVKYFLMDWQRPKFLPHMDGVLYLDPCIIIGGQIITLEIEILSVSIVSITDNSAKLCLAVWKVNERLIGTQPSLFAACSQQQNDQEQLKPFVSVMMKQASFNLKSIQVIDLGALIHGCQHI